MFTKTAETLECRGALLRRASAVRAAMDGARAARNLGNRRHGSASNDSSQSRSMARTTGTPLAVSAPGPAGRLARIPPGRTRR